MHCQLASLFLDRHHKRKFSREIQLVEINADDEEYFDPENIYATSVIFNDVYNKKSYKFEVGEDVSECELKCLGEIYQNGVEAVWDCKVVYDTKKYSSRCAVSFSDYEENISLHLVGTGDCFNEITTNKATLGAVNEASHGVAFLVNIHGEYFSNRQGLLKDIYSAGPFTSKEHAEKFADEFDDFFTGGPSGKFEMEVTGIDIIECDTVNGNIIK